MEAETSTLLVKLQPGETQKLGWRCNGRSFELVYFEISSDNPSELLFSQLLIGDRRGWHAQAKVPVILGRVTVEPQDFNKGEILHLLVKNCAGKPCELQIKPIGDPL